MKKLFKKVSLLLISFLLLLTMVGCGTKNNETGETTEPNTGDVVEARTAIIFKEIDGNSATIKRNGTSESSYEGMRLMALDEIITDANTSIYLRVDDDKNILLDKDSSLSISELTNGKLRLKLNYGELFFEVINKLADDEEVNFDAGSTTMSIRGTSGGISLDDIKASFAIYDGHGVVTSGSDFETTLNPNMMLATDLSGLYQMSSVTRGDLSDVAQYYFDSNKEYQNKMEGSATGKILSGEEEGNGKLDDAPAQEGWVQQADGTWVLDAKQADKASQSYKESKATTTTTTTSKTPSVGTGAVVGPIINPTIPVIDEVLPCEHIKGQIPANELSKHVLVKYAQTYLSEKNAEIWHYDFTDACKDHYLCHLDLEVDANGRLTDEGYETLKMHLTSCKQCGERLCSETFLNNHTLDNGTYICNKAITVKFDNNEGIALKPMTVYPMDFVQRFKLPELEDISDKKFVGWFTDNPCIMITSLSEGEFAELAYDRYLNELEQYSEVTFTAVWEDITPTTATITLNANGGLFASMVDEGIAPKETVTLNLPTEQMEGGYAVDDILAKNGLFIQRKGSETSSWSLTGWLDSENNIYAENQRFTSFPTELKALWKEESLSTATITLNGNGGKFSNNESTVILNLPTGQTAYSVNGLLINNGLNIQNGDYCLVGWRSGDGTIHPSDEQFINSTTGVLDARWGHKVTFIVYDEIGQPTSQEIVTVIHGEKVSVPSKYQGTSIDWFVNGQFFDFNTPINADTTIDGYYPM